MDIALRTWFTLDAAGLADGWGGNLLTVSGLVGFILIGLATSRLWTRSQVNELTKRHDQQLKTTETVWAGRVDDAVRREGEWRELAGRWQTVVETQADAIDKFNESQRTILNIVTEMQRHQRDSRRGARSD